MSERTLFHIFVKSGREEGAAERFVGAALAEAHRRRTSRFDIQSLADFTATRSHRFGGFTPYGDPLKGRSTSFVARDNLDPWPSVA